MSKMFKRSIAAFMSALMLLQLFGFSAFADSEKNYIITNPYEAVGGMSGAPTNSSPIATQRQRRLPLQLPNSLRSTMTLGTTLLLSYRSRYTINRGWNKVHQTIPLSDSSRDRTHIMAPIIPPHRRAEYQAYISGTAASEKRTHKNGMLDVPKGIELNMATPIADCHLTGYFAEYGQGLAGVYGDYETPSAGVKKNGGISMLSHVGEYVYTDKDSADHVGQKVDDYYVNKFARIFLDNQGSSVGMGINSATDAHTRCDRILYDQILRKTIPNGVVPWAFCFSDSHNLRSINDAYTMMLMKDFDLDNFRSSMENGLCFAVSHYSNGYELDGEPEMPGFDENKVYDEELYLLDNTPMVTRVTVDQEKDTISVEGTNFDRIVWVSDCNVIKRTENITNGKATLDLHASDLMNEPNLYVRFYITGENGICYSQPFVLNVEGEGLEPVEVPETHDISTRLRTFSTIMDWLFFKFNPLIWVFKYFALGYSVFDRFFDAY